MCGIFAYLGPKRNAGEIIWTGLKSLEYRGYDSWGIVVKKSNNSLFIKKQIGKIPSSRFPLPASSIGIGHTRWATHGKVTRQNAHPHLSCDQKVVVVHNGIIENFQQLKNSLLKKGHKFTSETDTEVIVHLIEDIISVHDREQIGYKFFKKLKGLNAIVLFFPEKEEFVAVKNSSPLVFGINKKTGEFIISSDYTGIAAYTNQVYFLEDNEFLSVNRSGYKLFDSNGKIKKPKFIEIDLKKEDLSTGKYKHYMIKEINEQPQILTNILQTQKKTIEQAAAIIKKSYGAYLIGCGSAYYAALSGNYLFAKIAKRHINQAISSEFLYSLNFLKENSLVIALSQSGETIDTLASLKAASEKKAKLMTLTNVLGSTIYRLADYKILLQAGPEKCVLATKSFTAKIAYLYLMAYALNGDYNTGGDQIKKAADEIKKLIKNPKIKTIAQKLKNQKHIYILGRGVSYPTALESALKIKEISYIHAEGFAGGDLKHGVIALIEKKTPVIVYNPQDETYDDTLSSAYEVKARGAYLIGISSKENQVYDEFIPVENCQEATIIPNVVVAQLLGYYLALAKGYDPDKPRNLAKSVTVK
jgi:glucosamine--fructose-6-phosphate aminotransferase (isomerizing)